MGKRLVLSLCDRTGVMVQPWLEAGYECVTVDLQHERGVQRDGRLYRIGCDVATYMPPPAAIVFAFPSCTDVAVSGAKHFKDKGLEALHGSLGLLIACKRICEASGAPWMIENPVSTFSTYWRDPDFIFHPWQYARYLADVKQDAYTKKTCLWTGGGFAMPEMKPASFLHDADRIHKMARTKDRGDKRAVTPAGFARAVFEANEPRVRERVA
jgi:hypothetical protein